MLAVTVLQDQMLTQNMLASTATGGQFSILEPGETVGPDSEAWRAVSMTVPDDRAVGGMLQPGMTVDVLMSATVNVPQDLLTAGKYYTDKSTKITYQNMVILARDRPVLHRQGDARGRRGDHPPPGVAATRRSAWPCGPRRMSGCVDASTLGETTNRLIAKYGLPVPENFPPGNGPLPTPLRRQPHTVADADARRVAPGAVRLARSKQPLPDPLTRVQRIRPAAPVLAPLPRAADPARLPGHPARRRGPGGRSDSVVARLSRSARVARSGRRPGVEDAATRVSSMPPDVSITRVAAGRSRRGRIALGGDPLARPRPRPSPGRAGARAGRPGSHVTSQTSSHCVGEPALDEPDRLDRRRPAPRPPPPRATASSIRGRTAGMDDRLERRERRRVGEDDPPERRPVEGPVRPAVRRRRSAR